MNDLSALWYQGIYEEYRHAPWLHEQQPGAMRMPWTVVITQPMGYIVYRDSNGHVFKMLRNPVLVAGDVIA